MKKRKYHDNNNIPQSFKLDDIQKLDNPIINHHYEHDGKPVPRVTEIISSCRHNESLMGWANHLGFKHQSYKNVLNAAADYGTAVHSALEKYIKGEPIPDGTPTEPMEAFELWWKQLTRDNDVKVLGQEFVLTCPWYGGTYDMLLNINGKPWLVDFKTSNHIRVEYSLQLAAYRNMLKYNNIVKDLSGFVVLRLCKHSPEFEEFIIDMLRPAHEHYMNECSSAFGAMAYQYWMMKDIENKFKNIMG